MKSFALNHGMEQYNWMLIDVPEGTIEEKVVIAP